MTLDVPTSQPELRGQQGAAGGAGRWSRAAAALRACELHRSAARPSPSPGESCCAEAELGLVSNGRSSQRR